jgi:protein gp37
MGETKISWATHTVNIVHGCSKPAAVPLEVLEIAERVSGPIDLRWTKPNTSPECRICYAETLSNKRGWTPHPWLEKFEDENVMLKPERFKEITKLKVEPTHLPPSQRKRLFICSMGDLFHRNVPDEFLHRFFEVINQTAHIYQLLTKRPERAMNWPGPWTPNIWLGTTCGHPITKWRVECLRQSKAITRFVSMEPLLGDMGEMDFTGIHQCIVGGESGKGFRPMDMAWAVKLKNQCVEQGCSYFFKQDSAYTTERRTYVVENGVAKQWRQFPGEMTAPVHVEPDNAIYHNKQFAIVEGAA